MRKRKTFRSFQYNENFKKWLWFVNETLVGAFVGALIAFIFGDHYWAALIAFAVLMLFLILLSIFFIQLESKVSVLSIMNQGLKDGKYEDVIKFGSAMRTTLFTSNKNDDIVVLGYKLDEAASNIENAHYNKSKGDYHVSVDGKEKSITQIKIGIKIDDLGWSMHLCKRDEEAVVNIFDGIKRARNEALRLSRINGCHNGELVAPFVELVLRGYRHLAGIYYEDINQHWRARFFENVTRLIMSNYKIISLGGVCEGRKNNSKETACGLFCSLAYEKKIECARKKILELYYNSETINEVEIDFSDVYNFLSTTQNSLMSGIEIENDVKMFNLLPIKMRNAIIKEQCYAWGRNMVKKIQRVMYKQGEYDFISDGELSCKVAEARAFSQVYFYGTDPVAINDDFDNLIKKDVVGKSELRYASLINEIELVNLLQPDSQLLSDSGIGRNMKIEKLISNLNSTREICRDKRADLYVRASIHLITAYRLEYNLNYRYTTNDIVDKSLKSRKKILSRYNKTIEILYQEIKSYEHKANEDLESTYHFAMEDLKPTEKKVTKKIKMNIRSKKDIFIDKFFDIDTEKYQEHFKLARLNSGIHKFSQEETEKTKIKWDAL